MTELTLSFLQLSLQQRGTYGDFWTSTVLLLPPHSQTRYPISPRPQVHALSLACLEIRIFVYREQYNPCDRINIKFFADVLSDVTPDVIVEALNEFYRMKQKKLESFTLPGLPAAYAVRGIRSKVHSVKRWLYLTSDDSIQ